MLGAAGARRRVKLRQLEAYVPVWSPRHGDLRPDALEPDDAVHPIALDRRFALQLESELDEECHRVREIVYDYAHVVHALNCHLLDGTAAERFAGQISAATDEIDAAVRSYRMTTNQRAGTCDHEADGHDARLRRPPPASCS